MRQKLTLTTVVLLLLACAGMVTSRAASSYADPQFDAQWKQGEAITANFWGPLSTAKDSLQEDYKEAQGGKRTVQYFDKGRMELTNGKVTNGLLATEIVKGQIQTGDATSQGQPPPAIPIAGDPDNPGPTYAMLATKSVSILATAKSASGSNVTTTVSPTGDVTNNAGAAAMPETTVSAFDDKTGHNLPKVFADYRNKAGLATIGFAISEAFRTNVKVGGQPKDVMVQVFERRVLTYTASNPDAFKVEMGNIGQHYYTWRYSGPKAVSPSASASASASPSASASAAPAPSPTTTTAGGGAGTTASAATTAPGVAGAKNPPMPPATGGNPMFAVAVADIVPTVKVGDIQTVNVTTDGKAVCAIDITYSGNKPAASPGLQPKQADDSGKLNWTWTIGGEAKPGGANFVVNCTKNYSNQLGAQSGSFSVSG